MQISVGDREAMLRAKLQPPVMVARISVVRCVTEMDRAASGRARAKRGVVRIAQHLEHRRARDAMIRVARAAPGVVRRDQLCGD